MARILMIEPTPNPMAFKLRLDQKVAVGGSKQYNKKEECWDMPVAGKLFDVHGVESVFLMDDFITVTKTVGGIWDYIFFQANEILMAAKDIVAIRVGEGGEFKNLDSDEFDKLPSDQKLSYIDRVIDETIRPGLARDGGNLKILGLEENILRVQYQGACGSCPSSTGATLNYISNMLQSRVSPNIQVIPG
ncbi:MAG TPA: NifU family protein [bacterium]|nr:NifU family protein [bacterium]